MHSQLKVLIILAIVIVPYQLIAQKKFTTRIEFPTEIKMASIYINYDNGKHRNNKLKPKVKDNHCVISGEFFSRYATIMIGFENDSTSYYDRFWVNEKPAIIKFINPSEKKLTNAIDLKTIEEEQFSQSILTAQKNLDDFYDKNHTKFRENDSLRELFSQKMTTLEYKKLAFVKTYNKTYFSLFLFKDFVYSDDNLDSLYKIYNSFPDSLKNTFEGKSIEQAFYGRSIKNGVKAPDFNTKDINGKRISLADFKGKYLLLNFWASWCEPCIAELPAINLIRDTYSSNQIEILSVTQDTKNKAFKAAVKKYKMNWLHVFRDMDLLISYGDMSIPKVFLIDPVGNIIYVRDEVRDIDLSILTELVRDKLKK